MIRDNQIDDGPDYMNQFNLGHNTGSDNLSHFTSLMQEGQELPVLQN